MGPWRRIKTRENAGFYVPRNPESELEGPPGTARLPLPAPCLGPRTLQEMVAEPHVCVVPSAIVVMTGGGGRWKDRSQRP